MPPRKGSQNEPVVTEKVQLTQRILVFLKSAKWLPWLLALLFLLGFLTILSGQVMGRATKITISILGQTLTVETSASKITVPVYVVIVDGVSYVRTASGDTPLRLWLEAQGYNVSWSQENQTVVAEKGT